MSNYIVNPTYEIPEKLCNGMIVQNIFIPVTDIVGVINKCGIQTIETAPTMMLSGCNYSYYNGEYESKTDREFIYYKHKTNNCYVGMSYYGTYWTISDYLCSNGKLENGQFFNYSTSNICPYDGWLNYEDLSTSIKTDFVPRQMAHLCVNNCGPNAEYIWNGVVGLNGDGETNTFLKEVKTEVPQLAQSLIKTPDAVVYWGDILLKNKVTEEIENIYRCNFTTKEVYKIRIKGYTDPIYAMMSDGATFDTAIDFKKSVNDEGHVYVQMPTSTNMFYIKRKCYQGVRYEVYGYGGDEDTYRDKRAGLMDQSGNYINGLQDNDSLEQQYFTASYTGWYYYVCQTYNNTEWNESNTLEIHWDIQSGSEPTE